MRKLLIALAVVAFAVFPATMAASVTTPAPLVETVAPTGEEGGDCPTDPERVRFYENVIGDTTDGNDSILFCGSSWDDLDTREHTLPGGCKAKIALDDDWDDCISSLYAIIPAGRRLCLYSERNYNGIVGGYTICIPNGGSGDGERVNFEFIPGHYDGLSSWRFLNNCPPTCS